MPRLQSTTPSSFGLRVAGRTVPLWRLATVVCVVTGLFLYDCVAFEWDGLASCVSDRIGNVALRWNRQAMLDEPFTAQEWNQLSRVALENAVKDVFASVGSGTISNNSCAKSAAPVIWDLSQVRVTHSVEAAADRSNRERFESPDTLLVRCPGTPHGFLRRFAWGVAIDHDNRAHWVRINSRGEILTSQL